jgi:hypothetical protein
MRKILIEPDDEGPVDVEHIEAVAVCEDGGDEALLERLNKVLRQCARPARASLWEPD